MQLKQEKENKWYTETLEKKIKLLEKKVSQLSSELEKYQKKDMIQKATLKDVIEKGKIIFINIYRITI